MNNKKESLGAWVWSYIISIGVIGGGTIAFIITWAVKGFWTACLYVLIGAGGLFAFLVLLMFVLVFAEWLHDNIFTSND